MQGRIPRDNEVIECSFVVRFLNVMRRDQIQGQNLAIRLVKDGITLTTNSTWNQRQEDDTKVRSNLPIKTWQTPFHRSSAPDSWQMVMPIRRWMPWWSRNRPAHGLSSERSTVTAAYLKNIRCRWRETKAQEKRDGTHSPFGDNSKISYQTRRSCVASIAWFELRK